MIEYSIDFETRSTVDLRKVGVYKYVESPDTDIICMAYRRTSDTVTHLWKAGDPLPEWFLADLAAGATIRAWNAQFERLVWNTVGVERYGFPPLARDRFFCTEADALAMGLPGSLDKASRAMRLDVKKDMDGHRLALRMCRPRTTNPLTWWDDEERLERLYAYCRRDVETEMEIAKRTRRLAPAERAVYLLDQTVNDRGVFVDLPAVQRAKRVALEGIRRANASVAKGTDGDVETITQVGRLQHWLREQGCDIPDLRANTLQKYLQTPLPEHVRQVLLARAEAGKASVSKLDKMQGVANSDGRMRGLLQYHGAATGRWAGRLVQPQNFPRGILDMGETEWALSVMAGPEAYDHIDFIYNPVEVVSSSLRSMLRADEGSTLMAADFSAIEARVLAWLAGQDDLVQAFRSGVDVYAMTADLFGTTRQVGKAIILGAGYGMGHKKFCKMASEAYGIVDMQEEEAKRFIDKYRNLYGEIPKFWNTVEDSVRGAVASGQLYDAAGGSLRFAKRGDQLWIVLPSGRPLCYWYPTLVERTTPWGAKRTMVEFSTQDSITRKWVRRDLYGGLITENIVQAVARDMLVHSMQAVEAGGYPVILTVHDEIVCEVPEGVGTYLEFRDLMSSSPEWAAGCPIKVSGWEGRRYRKG
jgi:DNA polymerase